MNGWMDEWKKIVRGSTYLWEILVKSGLSRTISDTSKCGFFNGLIGLFEEVVVISTG